MNNEISEAITEGIINLKLRFLLHIADNRDQGVTSAELTKFFGVSYAYASISLASFEKNGYITTLTTKN